MFVSFHHKIRSNHFLSLGKELFHYVHYLCSQWPRTVRFLAHHGCGVTALIPDLRNMKGTDLPSNLPSALSAPKQTFPLLTRLRGDRSQQPHSGRALFSRINLILEMRTRVSESLVSLSCPRATESGQKPRSMATEPSCLPRSKQPPSSWLPNRKPCLFCPAVLQGDPRAHFVPIFLSEAKAFPLVFPRWSPLPGLHLKLMGPFPGTAG